MIEETLGDCFELADLCEEKEVTVEDTLDPVAENKAKMDGKLANLALMEKHGVHVTEVPPTWCKTVNRQVGRGTAARRQLQDALHSTWIRTAA